MPTCILEPHPEHTFVWRLYSESGSPTAAFVPALTYPAPAGASADDLARLASWLDGAF